MHRSRTLMSAAYIILGALVAFFSASVSQAHSPCVFAIPPLVAGIIICAFITGRRIYPKESAMGWFFPMLWFAASTGIFVFVFAWLLTGHVVDRR